MSVGPTVLERFRERLVDAEVDAAFIAGTEAIPGCNVRYLSGFRGSSAYCFITREAAYLLTDARYTELAAAWCPGWDVVRHERPMERTLQALVSRYGVTKLGYEGGKIPVRVMAEWQGALGDVEWCDIEGAVEQERLVKRPEEVALLRRVAEMGSRAIAAVLPDLEGRSEVAVALRLETLMMTDGADPRGFHLVLASGPRGSMPHGRPTDRVIASGDLVTIDFGAALDGYYSDETVTVAVGSSASWQQEIFDVVHRAWEAGIEAVRPGRAASDVDAIVRGIIAEAGYGEYFVHATGHGVGLQLHEGPSLSRPGYRPDMADAILEPGMVLTVEPGIYLPGRGGARLEDTLLVSDGGAERLTQCPKEWRVV